MPQRFLKHNETTDSLVSYGVGTAGVAAGSMLEIAQSAQALAMILGCIVVAIRLVHDGIRLYRYLKS